MGTTFPTFQSSGMVPSDNDCVNSAQRILEQASLAFFKIFEFISSMPVADEFFILSIMHEIPLLLKVMGSMAVVITSGSVEQGNSDSSVKTDEKAVLNAFAHSVSVIVTPALLVRVIARVSFGFITFQNFLGLSIIIFGRSTS